MFIKKLKSLSKNNITTVFKGNFFSKVILVIGGLFLAKLYGASDYGSFSIYISIATICSTLVSLGMEHLIILETKANAIANHFNSGNFISLTMTLFALMFCTMFLLDSFGGFTLILGILSGYLILYVNNAKLLLSKKNKYKWISLLTMCDATISFIMQAVFLYFKIDNGLIWGSFIGFFTAFIWSLFMVKKWIQIPHLHLFINAIKKRIDLVTLAYPSTLLNSLGNHIMPIFMGTYFLSKQVGEYAMAVKILSTPLLLISSSIAVVYYPKAVKIIEKKTKEELFNYTKKISLYNFFIMLGLFLLLNTMGVYLLNIFFNNEWEHLTLYVLLLSFGFLVRSLVNPIVDILTILKKNHIDLLFNVYLLLSNFIVLLIGKEFGFSWLVGSFSFFISLGYGALYLYITFYLENNELYPENHRVSNFRKNK